jgi:UDPglucose 6-dehydrogenase
VIAVVGSGVVGQASGKGFHRLGFDVLFVDVNERTLSQLADQGYEVATPATMDLRTATAVFVSVPTPYLAGGIDLHYLDEACKSIGLALRGDYDHFPVVVFRSTIPPGTTRNRLTPRIAAYAGKIAGTDFGVCYNPEYLRAESALKDFLAPRLATIASLEPDDRASQVVRSVYRKLNVAIVECTYEQAEFQKYVHNTYNAAKISFFNEMRIVAKELGIDPDIAFAVTAITAEGMWNARYGTYDNGPYGGACLPKDTAAWLQFARERELDVPLMQAVDAVNALVSSRTEPVLDEIVLHDAVRVP